MAVLSFTLTRDCCKHLLFLRAAAFPWKVKIITQVVITITICMMNAYLCAGQDTGFSMLMSSLALMALNNIDDVIATLIVILGGLDLDKVELKVLDRKDFHFAKYFAVPHMIWVGFYSLFFLGIIPIGDPTYFVNLMELT